MAYPEGIFRGRRQNKVKCEKLNGKTYTVTIVLFIIQYD